ncbi:MAG: methionyl-tRNA formyltransferase [Chloroflexi bacterium]|nr:methionyl-tRNA formyltransferase [Chloroflexota bacterium]
MRIVFMGSPQFALPAIEWLIGSGHELLAVVTQPDQPAGRGRSLRPPPVSELARAHGLPVLQPPRVNAPESLDALRALKPEAIVIVAYGQILKQPLLDIPSRGLLNVHASLLPRHRGAAPATAALLAGDAETGVTILEVVLALDAGPMLARRSLAISDDATTGSLNEKLAPLGAELLIETLPAWERGELTPQPQDEALATYAPTVRREDAIIDWSLPAADVWRRVRAYSPWPVATTSFDGEPLRVLEAWPLDVSVDVVPGVVLPLPDGVGVPEGAGFAVRCGEGALAVIRAQRAGRRALSGEELLRGARGLLGKQLGG